jgi:ABC-2 type transport system ATP-binding protein
MIQVNRLTKVYGLLTALDDVSFEVGKGEILGFLGPNGAGKTTMMRILSGFFPATEGTAKVAGFDVFQQPLEVKRRVGYLPEHPPLYTEMTVDAFLKFAARIKGVEKSQVETRLAEVKEKCGLSEMGERLIKHLSKGFRQRVGLAQAMIHSPEVLILDEPTVGLDPKQIIEVRELIKSLGGEHTIILSTHILPEVSMTCERVIIINNGRIVAVDTPQNLTNQLSGGQRIELEVEGPVAALPELLSAIPGVSNILLGEPRNGHDRVWVETEPGKEIRHLVSRAVVEHGFELYQIRNEAMTLEEIFLRLTTEEDQEAAA